MQQMIDNEHGSDYCKNINLHGYVLHNRDSFIAFHFVYVNNTTTVHIDYIYITNKKSLISLLAFCMNFWIGNNVKFIYYNAHCRPSDYDKKYLAALGFHVSGYTRTSSWRQPWKSRNGYAEDEMLEAYTL